MALPIFEGGTPLRDNLIICSLTSSAENKFFNHYIIIRYKEYKEKKREREGKGTRSEWEERREREEREERRDTDKRQSLIKPFPLSQLPFQSLHIYTKLSSRLHLGSLSASTHSSTLLSSLAFFLLRSSLTLSLSFDRTTSSLHSLNSPSNPIPHHVPCHTSHLFLLPLLYLCLGCVDVEERGGEGSGVRV